MALRTLRILLCAGASATISFAACSQSVGARFGTTGLNVEGGYGFNEWLAVRGNYGHGSLDYTFTKSDIEYSGKVKARVGLLTLDVHPFAGSFRLSAGLGSNNTTVDAKAEFQTGTLDINGTVYSSGQVTRVQGRVTFERTVPYLGLGWGVPAKPGGGWYFSSDFGVIFSKASGSVNGTCDPSLTPASCARLQNDLNGESEQFRQEMEKEKYYPVITLGVGYRF